MKTLLMTIALLSSVSAFADYKCTLTKWSPGLFGKYYLSGLPQKYEIPSNQPVGYFEGVEVASISVGGHHWAHDGEVRYALNGKMSCKADGDNCALSGDLAEMFIGKESGNAGLMHDYIISISGKGEQLIPMQENHVLKVSCE